MFSFIARIFNKPAKLAIIAPISRKHIRIANWMNHSVVTYYGADGKKVTSRKVATMELLRIKRAAVAKGYKAI